MALLPDLVLWTMLLTCLYTDLTCRKIYNKVVYPATLLGIVLAVWQQGLSGLQHSMLGLGVGLLLFLVPFTLGGLGAGDIKLLAAIGAIKGVSFVCYAALGTALAGGVIALGFIIWKGETLSTLKRVALTISLLCSGTLSQKKDAQLFLDRTPFSSYFPYGAAIFAGTMLAHWIGRFFLF